MQFMELIPRDVKVPEGLTTDYVWVSPPKCDNIEELALLLSALAETDLLQQHIAERLRKGSADDQISAIVSLRWFPPSVSIPLYVESLEGATTRIAGLLLNSLQILHARGEVPASYYPAIEVTVNRVLSDRGHDLGLSALYQMAQLGSKEALCLMAAQKGERKDSAHEWALSLVGEGIKAKLSEPEGARWLKSNLQSVRFDVAKKRFMLIPEGE